MIHFPSDMVRQELASNPSLVRVVTATGLLEDELTLIIKTHSLALKYIFIDAQISIHVVVISNYEVCYYLQIEDDDQNPILFWSGAKDQLEIDLLKRLAAGEKAYAFLFNEACANVGSAALELELLGDTVLNSLSTGRPFSRPETLVAAEVFAAIDSDKDNTKNRISIKRSSQWHMNNLTYITNSLDRSMISFDGTDEGDQQQELARWLIDGLQPNGAFLSPQLHEISGKKEFTDLLLSYELGAFIIESKTLSLFSRPTIPGRAKLSRGIIKHINDATGRQLRTACRQLRENIRIFDKKTEAEIRIPRRYPAHAICLVPDLSLIRGQKAYGKDLLNEFIASSKAYLHILDTTQLFRMVQAAQMLSQKSAAITPIMAFDSHLIERFDFAKTIDEPDIDMILDLTSDSMNITFSYY